MWHNFAEALGELRRTYREAFDAYHPELHYMRGPGPKCRAKCDGTADQRAPLAADAMAALHQIAKAHA